MTDAIRAAGSALPDEALGQLFRDARSMNGYLDEPVSDALLDQLYGLVASGPTSTNCQPGRFIFVRTEEHKARLAACVAPNNKPKVLAAPVTVIVGMDMDFVEQLPQVFPHADVRPMYESVPGMIEATAFRNSSLQGGYLILAARALGLDCGPMSGFSADAVDAAFWRGSNVRTNFLCTLGRGDWTRVFPKLPRLSFSDACQLI